MNRRPSFGPWLLMVPLTVLACSGDEPTPAAGSGGGSGFVSGVGTGGHGGGTGSVTTGVGTGGSGGDAGAGGSAVCAPFETKVCYVGPPGTQGIGICKAGLEKCAPDGSAFGPCEGQVLPQVEDCFTPTDDDCDGDAPPCSDPPLFAALYGDGSDQFGRAVAVDAAANVYVTGSFAGTMTFGGFVLASSGGIDAFLVKLDPSGTPVWAKKIGSVETDRGLSVAVDSTGNVIVAGHHEGAIDLGGGSLPAGGPGTPRMYLAKFDSSGAHVFSKSFAHPSTQDEVYAGLGSDPLDNIFLTSSFTDATDLGGGAIAAVGNNDVFIVKFDAQGTHLWSKAFGDGESQRAGSLAVDPNGDVALIGSFSGTIDFGGGPLTAFVGPGKDVDVYVTKLDASGAHLWSKRFGGADVQLGKDIALDASGGIFVTGAFLGDINFGGGNLVGDSEGDVFVARLAPEGTHVWSKRFGDGVVQYARGLAVDEFGGPVIGGFFGGVVDFGGGPLTASGGLDLFLAKLDASGAHVWSRRFGSSFNDDSAEDVAVDSTGHVLATGHVRGAVDFGGGPLTSQGGDDVFLVKLDP